MCLFSSLDYWTLWGKGCVVFMLMAPMSSALFKEYITVVQAINLHWMNVFYVLYMYYVPGTVRESLDIIFWVSQKPYEPIECISETLSNLPKLKQFTGGRISIWTNLCLTRPGYSPISYKAFKEASWPEQSRQQGQKYHLCVYFDFSCFLFYNIQLGVLPFIYLKEKNYQSKQIIIFCFLLLQSHSCSAIMKSLSKCMIILQINLLKVVLTQSKAWYPTARVLEW